MRMAQHEKVIKDFKDPKDFNDLNAKTPKTSPDLMRDGGMPSRDPNVPNVLKDPKKQPAPSISRRR